MTPEQAGLVKDSWAKVVPISETAAELFYGRLFEIAPEVKPMFASSDMKEQGAKLMKMITMAVASLDNLDALVPAVQNLGRQHVGYGVKDEHYDYVGSALLWTLGQGLGDDFNEPTRDAWATTYGILSKTMIDAAHADAA